MEIGRVHDYRAAAAIAAPSVVAVIHGWNRRSQWGCWRLCWCSSRPPCWCRAAAGGWSSTTVAALWCWCCSKCWTEEKKLLLELSSDQESPPLCWNCLRLELLEWLRNATTAWENDERWPENEWWSLLAGMNIEGCFWVGSIWQWWWEGAVRDRSFVSCVVCRGKGNKGVFWQQRGETKCVWHDSEDGGTAVGRRRWSTKPFVGVAVHNDGWGYFVLWSIKCSVFL